MGNKGTHVNRNEFVDVNKMELPSSYERIIPYREGLRYESRILEFYTDKTTIQDGDSLTITYTRKLPCYGAYFNIVPKNVSVRDWGVCHYLSQPSTLNEQVWTTTIDAFGQVGEWEVRFFSDDGYESLAGRLPITVVGEAYDGIHIELEKDKVEEGDDLIFTYSIDQRIPISDPRVSIAPKSSPCAIGIVHVLDDRNGSKSIRIPRKYISGPQEIRFLPTVSAAIPCGKTPFAQTSVKASTIKCHPEIVQDGANLFIEYKNKYDSEDAFLSMYPIDMPTEPSHENFPIVYGEGSMHWQVDSKKNPGVWEVRLGNEQDLIIAVQQFTINGTDERFFLNLWMNASGDVDFVIQ